MHKIIPTQRLLSTVSICAALVAILLLVLPAVQAQQDAQAGSGAQLRIDVNPLLGLNVLAPTHAPDYFNTSVTASGDVAVNVGAPCLSGYTSSVATVGLAWVGASGPVDIEFAPTQQKENSTGLLMWDVSAQRWWCTDPQSETNTLHFNNMPQGMYFMWVVTADKNPVAGEISVTGPVATAES